MTVASIRRSRGLVAAAIAAICTFAGANAVAGPASAKVLPGQSQEEPRLTRAQRLVLLQATSEFRNVRRAVAAGYVPTDQCVPAMGYHYVHPALANDSNIDPTMPEILVYARRGDGARSWGSDLFAQARIGGVGRQRTQRFRQQIRRFGIGFDQGVQQRHLAGVGEAGRGQPTHHPPRNPTISQSTVANGASAGIAISRTR
jgi:hypothetical protein